MTEQEQWWWCLRHGRAEPGDPSCKASSRLGPYASEEEARAYAERVEARNEAWEDEDERWHGRKDD